jgi:hypothetical protein
VGKPFVPSVAAERKGNAEILFELFKSFYANWFKRHEKELPRRLPKEWLAQIEPTLRRLDEFVNLDDLGDHPSDVLSCVKVAIWGEFLKSGRKIQREGRQIPPPQELIKACFDTALSYCIESYSPFSDH